MSARRAASVALKHASLAADAVRPASMGVTILLYHRTEASSGTLVDLPAATFAAQLRLLREHTDILTLDDALDRLDRSQPLARPATVLTFDDGTADYVDVALPLLVDAQVPSTLYVATAFVDEGRRWPDGCASASWSALRDALSTGLVTIGSHSDEHRLFDRLTMLEAVADLDRSLERLAEQLSVVPRHFAYPKALAASATVEPAIRERFHSAVLAGNRVNLPGRTERHRLGRTPIQTTDGERHFLAKARGGMRSEAVARELANRVRYRGAVE